MKKEEKLERSIKETENETCKEQLTKYGLNLTLYKVPKGDCE